MLPRKNIDEPNVNNSPRGYPKGSPKLPLGHPYARLHIYTRKLGSRCIRAATGNLKAPYGGHTPVSVLRCHLTNLL